MLHLIAEHMKLPGRTKALGCWSFALTSLVVAGVYLLTWKHYQTPDPVRWVQVQGRVNSDGTAWKPDRTLLQFGAKFALPGETQTQVRPVYADRQAFSAAGLRAGAPVVLTVEHGAEGVVVRELATPEGRLLYDDSLYRHVVKTANDAARLPLIVCPALAVLGALAGAFFWFRQVRTS